MDEFVFGKNPILEVIKNKDVQANKIWISESLKDSSFKNDLVDYAKENKIPYHFVPINKIDSLVKGQNHQGAILSISPIKYLSVKELIAKVSSSTNNKTILVINEIEDSHNIGAMIRTFVGANGEGVILSGRKSPGISSITIKTSAGAIFKTALARASNCVNVINELKKNDFWIIGTDVSKEAKSIYEINFPEKIAIIVGNEHEGLGQLIKKNCDFLLNIPISNQIDSLNVSVAFGIVLFEALRQQKKLNS